MTTLNDVRRLTNVDDLIRPSSVNRDSPQPAIDHAIEDPFVLPHRTADPLQSNFYLADIATALSSRSRLKTSVIVLAWLFLAVPSIGYWLWVVVDFLASGGWREIQGVGDAVVTVGGFIGLTIGAGVWPYMLLRRYARQN